MRTRQTRQSNMILASLIFLAVSACKDEAALPNTDESDPVSAAPTERATAPSSTEPSAVPLPLKVPVGDEWETTSSDEGAGLFFGAAEGEAGIVHMFCDRAGRLVVNAPGFQPKRGVVTLVVSAGGTALHLDADPSGDARRGGVSGNGPIPLDFSKMLQSASGLKITYGDQSTSRMSAVPEDTARSFIEGCAGT